MDYLFAIQKKDEYVALQCDRSGAYPDVRSIGEKRKRSTTSCLIECSFHIVGTVTTCIGHFMATMGLSCVHKINSLQGMTLSLDLVHPHWRIDTLSLDPEDDSHNEIEDQFAKLLNELQSKHQMWPLSKKELATSMLTKFLNQPDVLIETMIQRPRGRPPKAKKKRGVTSTTRDPSRFEYVESSQAHDPSSSSNGFPKTIHQENGVIDLNGFLDF
nr:protein FAR1-related sequence 5 [Tanacetum cinerariifolium]